MSFVIAPEVTVDADEMLVEFCSNEFSAEELNLSLQELDAVAAKVREACRISAQAMDNAKSNILLAYMAQPGCRRWLKKEFSSRVGCENSLLSKMARQAKFKFHTNESLVVECIENRGDDSDAAAISESTGVAQRSVERIVEKRRAKMEAELADEAAALEESLSTDNDDSAHETAPVVVQVVSKEDREEIVRSVVEAVVEKTETLVEEEASSAADGEEIAISDVDPEVERAKNLPTMAVVNTITEKVKEKLESDYLEEITQLKVVLSDKDAEIARLKALLADAGVE